MLLSTNENDFINQTGNDSHIGYSSVTDSLIVNLAGEPLIEKYSFDQLNYFDEDLVDEVLNYIPKNSRYGSSISHLDYNNRPERRCWLLKKWQKLYPSEKDILRKKESELCDSIPCGDYVRIDIPSLTQEWEERREVLSELQSIFSTYKAEPKDIEEINYAVYTYTHTLSNLSNSQKGYSTPEKYFGLDLSLRDEPITARHGAILRAIYNWREKYGKDKSLPFGSANIQPEECYYGRSVDIFDYQPNVQKWFEFTEEFGIRTELGQKNIIHYIKCLMARYHVEFTTAFLMYKILVLERFDSKNWGAIENLEVSHFSEINDYNADTKHKMNQIVLRQYQCGYADYINRFLRDPNEVGTGTLNKVNMLLGTMKDTILRNRLKQDTTLYRIVHHDGMDLRTNMKVGDTFLEKGFVSTSFTPDFCQKKLQDFQNKGILLEIHTPTGTPFIHMDAHFHAGSNIVKGIGSHTVTYTGQCEVILQPNTIFLVRDISIGAHGVKTFRVDIIESKN